MIGIYKITNPKGKIYIGQSIDIKDRLRRYKNLNCKQQYKIYNSLIKYSHENHKFEIIEECLESELTVKEQYWIKYHNSINEGLNLIQSKGGKRSNKVKYEHTEEFKNNLIQRLNNNKYALGNIHSEETKKRMSEAKNSTKIKIYCPELNKEFESIRSASKELNLKFNSISLILKGKVKKTRNGLTFKVVR
jgi:group I intron endonuclease